ncbi:MAG: hypothetical protein ACRDX8_05015 [Acidimicrobiales bacterium]
MAPFDQDVPVEPPTEAEEWSEEQWLQWLNATDPVAALHPAAASQMRRAPQRGGRQVLGQAMLGLANAIYGQVEDVVAIVSEAPAEPDEEEPFRVHLDPEHPEHSSVVFRPGPHRSRPGP